MRQEQNTKFFSTASADSIDAEESVEESHSL